MNKLILILFAAVNFLTAASFSITPNQVDNFEDNTTQDWTTGTLNPVKPAVLSEGSNKFLRVVSSGSITAGGKLVFFNSVQWTGNYIAANITGISMLVRNSGTSPLMLRIAFKGAGTTDWFVSTNPVSLPPDGIWKVISFPAHAADLTGTGDASVALAGVTTLRILHSSSANYVGDPVSAQLDVDDITALSLTAAENDINSPVPRGYSLEQNYPNPFNPETTIKYSLPFESSVTISVYNILGKFVKDLVTDIKHSGLHSMNFNAAGLSSGIYFYTIKAVSTDKKTTYNSTRKMTLLK
jgi:hypothetical protein